MAQHYPGMGDALALAAAALWFTLNIVLWIMHLPDLAQFVCSVALGIIFTGGFFGYLGYRDRRNLKPPDK